MGACREAFGPGGAAPGGRGADFSLLRTNTMHKVPDSIEQAVAIPLLHLAAVTGLAVAATGIKSVGLPGTSFIMEQDFYRDRIAGHGHKVLIPDAGARQLVHGVIYNERVMGVVSQDSRDSFVRIIADLTAQGVEGIIPG
ncbi:MAG: aspartate/glutamate racemase family protein [Specibacter sp.]